MNVFYNVTEKKTKQLCYEKGYNRGWRELKSFYLAFAFYMRIDQAASKKQICLTAEINDRIKLVWSESFGFLLVVVCHHK